jgi:hypothetical protein
MRYDIDNVLGRPKKWFANAFFRLLRSYSGNNRLYFAAAAVVNARLFLYDGITKI